MDVAVCDLAFELFGPSNYVLLRKDFMEIIDNLKFSMLLIFVFVWIFPFMNGTIPTSNLFTETLP
jgi:hypothetical protein